MRAQITYKSFATNPDYFVLCEKGVLRVVQDETISDYAVGEFIEIQGRRKADVLYADSIEPVAEEDEQKAAKEAEQWQDAFMDLRDGVEPWSMHPSSRP